MTIRDEFASELLLVSGGEVLSLADVKLADAMLPWLEQKFTEAQVEMVACCAEVLTHLAAELRIVKDGVSADLAADAIQESTEVIRALSPDPEWLNGKITEVVEQVADGVRAWRDRNCIKDSTTYSVLTDVVAAIREGLIYEPLKGHADPEWLERQKQRWELEARQKEARWWRYQSAGFFRMQTNDARLQADERLGALDDQLAALPEVKR